MKKLISLLLSVVMTISIVGSLDFSASAAEATPYFTEQDIQFLTSKFSYSLTESEKAMYTDTIKNISPDMEWSKTDWDVVQFYCKNIQKVWAATDLMLPDTITENEFAKLGKGSITYISSSIEIFKNIYYISQTDVNNIEKVYHGIGIFQSVCKVLGWSLGTFGSVLSVVSATLPIADLLYNSTIQEDLAFYEMDLQVAYYTQASLPTPDEAMVKPAFSDYLGKEELENGLYALYLKYSFMRIADNLKNSTQVNDVGEKCNFEGHTYQVFNISMTWSDAKEYCETKGGHLVTLNSQAEDQFIFDFVDNSSYNFVEFWAGGSDFNSEGNWYWVTNEIWEYSNWGKGEPDNNGNNQHYLCVCLEEKSGLGWSCGKTEWDDVDDNRLNGMGFVCEWDSYIDLYPTISDEHHYEKSVILPSCTEDGYTINKCVDCGLSYNSNHTSAMGHSYKLTNVVEQSCTSQGYDLYTCSVCGATEKRNYVNALGHKYEFTKTITPTCSAQGYDLYTCSVCGSTEKRNYVNALGHKYEFIKTVEPTCDEKGYDLYICTVCQSTEQRNIVNALGHKYEVVSNTATCTEAGVKTSVCSVCGETMETEVSALGHSYDSVYTSPTCTESGGYVNTCTRCGYVEIIEYSAKGHDYGQLYGKEYLDAISNSNISSTPGYIGEYYSTSSSIGSDTTNSINSSTVSFPNEIRLDIDHINDISEYQFSIKGGWFNFRTFDCIFICDNTTGRLPEQSAIPYTDKEGNLVNMKYVDYKVNGQWLCGEYILNGENITDLTGETVCSQFEETRPHIVFTRQEALDNGVMNADGTINVDYKLIDENEISFATGIPGIYFASTHITATTSRKYFVAFCVDESMHNSIKPGKYELELYFYNSYKNATGKTTIKIYDSDELIKVTPATEHSNEKITYTCIDCGETEIKEIIKTDPDALEAAIEMFDSLDSVDYSTQSYSNLSSVVEEYRTVIETAQTQQEIDDAVTAILEAMYDLVPNLNLNVSAENGSYEVQYDSTTSSDSKYSLLFGTEVTLTATANDGYKFVGWYDETSGVYLSKESTYTFNLTANMNIKAVFAEERSSTLTFTTYSNWVKDEITKTVDEWNEITSIEDMLPEVPYRYGYSNGQWVYDNDEVLAKLRAGQNVSIVAEYDADDDSLPTPPTPDGDVPVLDLYYKLDANENIGSFVMATGIPEDCQIESVGMAFYYKNANQFDPENFELLLNNKMLTSTFDIDENNIYIANIERFTSKNNWAARGYITYYDADGNLKTVYSNQINIVGREQV